MDALTKKPAKTGASACRPKSSGPSREEAEAAVRTLIAWAGDDPTREGLVDTPRRVLAAYEEFYAGYGQNPAEALDRTFEDVGSYDDIVLVRDIPFYSHCEHHMVPFVGKAHIAYFPTESVVGLSKLARVARRLRAPPADAGAADRRRRRGDRRDPEAARHRRHDRGGAPMHDAARRPQARRLDRDDAVHRHLPRRPGRAAAVHGAWSRARQGMTGLLPAKETPMAPPRFTPRGDHETVETGTAFMPKFDADGLIVAIAVDAATGDVLMVAHMNEEALARTIATGEGWFWSRSRRELWRKGDTSGNRLAVREMRVDCDQDAILLKVEVAGDGVACHQRLPLLLLPQRAARRARTNAALAFDRDHACAGRRQRGS